MIVGGKLSPWRQNSANDHEFAGVGVTALLWGLVGSSSLLVGAAIAYVRPPGQRTTALIMAFGVGVLISAVAYDLVEEAFNHGEGAYVFAGLAVGALTYYLVDLAIDRSGGEHRKRSTGAQADGSGAAIAAGSVLDGIPESVVLGTTLIGGGGIETAVLVAIFLSNLPEAMAATVGLRKAGTSARNVWAIWIATTLVSGAAAGIGYAVLGNADPNAVAVVQAFAAGALLTMLIDTMIPEAHEFGGRETGLVTVVGFAVAFGLSSL